MQASIASAVECLAELDVKGKEWKANWTRNRNIFFWRVGKTDIQEAAIFFIVALGCLLLHLSSWPADKIGCRVRTSHSLRKNYANDAVKKEILEPASAVEEIKQDKDIRATWDSEKKYTTVESKGGRICLPFVPKFNDFDCPLWRAK